MLIGLREPTLLKEGRFQQLRAQRARTEVGHGPHPGVTGVTEPCLPRLAAGLVAGTAALLTRRRRVQGSQTHGQVRTRGPSLPPSSTDVSETRNDAHQPAGLRLPEGRRPKRPALRPLQPPVPKTGRRAHARRSRWPALRVCPPPENGARGGRAGLRSRASRSSTRSRSRTSRSPGREVLTLNVTAFVKRHVSHRPPQEV